MSRFSTFTSESVSEGHPDKICDQISDAILDTAHATDQSSRVAVECLIKNDTLVVAGEVTTAAELGYDEIRDVAKDVLNKVGYTRNNGFNTDQFTLILRLNEQSENIKDGVDNEGAGDQGMMFGYASKETESFESMRGMFMPAPIAFSHELMRKHAEIRRTDLTRLGPDAKCQLSFQYNVEGLPIGISTVVFSTQHDEDYKYSQLKDDVIQGIIEQVIPPQLLQSTDFCVNPTGSFIKGGPEADCGLTGRKIIVDTYGGAAHHGGGAFSGKDPTKVDRSAAYAARYAAKNVVAAGLAEECEIQVSYAIGVADPTSISVNTFGTCSKDTNDEELEQAVRSVFDLRPLAIIDQLGLRVEKYLPTATFGHFGRANGEFSWERVDKSKQLREAASN